MKGRKSRNFCYIKWTKLQFTWGKRWWWRKSGVHKCREKKQIQLEEYGTNSHLWSDHPQTPGWVDCILLRNCIVLI